MNDFLKGRLILVVEDEPLIALDIIQGIECEGAAVITASTLTQALLMAEHPCLSAAILDHILTGGDCSRVYERMNERHIPFITYSGYDAPYGPWGESVHVKKPATTSMLVAILDQLFAGDLPVGLDSAVVQALRPPSGRLDSLNRTIHLPSADTARPSQTMRF